MSDLTGLNKCNYRNSSQSPVLLLLSVSEPRGMMSLPVSSPLITQSRLLGAVVVVVEGGTGGGSDRLPQKRIRWHLKGSTARLTSSQTVIKCFQWAQAREKKLTDETWRRFVDGPVRKICSFSHKKILPNCYHSASFTQRKDDSVICGWNGC